MPSDATPSETEVDMEQEFLNPFQPLPADAPFPLVHPTLVPAPPLSVNPHLPSSSGPHPPPPEFTPAPPPILPDTPFTIPAERRAARKLTRKEDRQLKPPRLGPAGPRLKDRDVRVFYKPQEVGQESIDFLLNQWRRCKPLHKMMLEVNSRQISSGKPQLSLLDLYAIFYKAYTDKLITQRREPANEMPLLIFLQFFQAWKKGGNITVCCEAARPYTNTYFLQRLHRAISQRYRTEQDVVHTAARADRIKATAYKLERTVLRHGQRVVLEGVAGVFIPVAKLPNYCLDVLREIPRVKDIFTLNGPGHLLDNTTIPTTEPLEEPVVPEMPKLDLKPNVPKPVPQPPPPLLDQLPPPPSSSNLVQVPVSEFDDMELDDLIFGDEETEEEEEETSVKESTHDDPFAPEPSSEQPESPEHRGDNPDG